MLLSIVSIVANVIYMAVLNIAFYTDRAMLPDGHYREWHRSPVSRLYISGQEWMFYVQIALTAISVISSLLLLFGVKHKAVRTVQKVSIIASTVMFVIILIVTSNIHAKYA